MPSHNTIFNHIIVFMEEKEEIGQNGQEFN
jgi:hypothetical protein